VMIWTTMCLIISLGSREPKQIMKIKLVLLTILMAT